MNNYMNVNKKRIGQMNLRNVMNCIRNNEPINRSAIAKLVGLSIPSVMSLTEELLKHGMIESVGRVDSGVGKHPEMLASCGDHYRNIGIDIGRTTVRVVIAGHNQKIIATSKMLTKNFERESEFVDQICKLVLDTIEESQIDHSTIVGICAAMPGLIEQDTGIVVFSPDFGWRDIPLQEWMNDRLPYQVIVENANRAQARWITRPGSNNENSTIICVGIGYGIGSAFILNGEMYYGSSGTSGEIGHITVCSDGAMCSCGNIGCLEAMASGGAIAEKAKVAVSGNQQTLLREMSAGNIDAIDAKMVFEAAGCGDTVASKLIDQAARYLGIALAMAINMLDPDAIYLCGGMMKNGTDFLNKIVKYTRGHQMQLAGRHVVIRDSSNEELIVALGATLIILDNGWKFDLLCFLY